MDSTATHRAKLWRTVLSWGVSNGYLPVSPLSGFKLRQVRARRIEPPTREEAERMYRIAAPHVQRVLVIGMAAGPRIGPSELFQLQWKDVHLSAGYMRMPNAHKGAEEDSRIVPIRDDILPVMREWQQADAAKGYQWVIHWHGKQVRNIGHAWHKAREAAGIDRRISPYSLRHAMPTDALEHGADPKAVAEVMGHADLTMILDTYQRVRFRLKKKAVNAAPGLRIHHLKSTHTALPIGGKMKIYLYAIDKGLAEAWQNCLPAELQDCIEIRHGDIFVGKADAIVSPANSYGFMDGGIDELYTKHFGIVVQQRLQAQIQKLPFGELLIGQALLVPTDNAGYPFCVSAPTMRMPCVLHRALPVYLATRAAVRCALDAELKSLAVPGMGTGTGQLPYGVAAAAMMQGIVDALHPKGFPRSLSEAMSADML